MIFGNMFIVHMLRLCLGVTLLNFTAMFFAQVH